MFDGRVDPSLVNLLLNEMGSEPDQLPVLQHLLMRMWSLPRAPDEDGDGQIVLTPAHYERVGGLADALSRHADAALEELSPEERRIAEILFRGLTEREAGNRDTRRPTPLGSVAEMAGVEWEQVARVVEVFRRPERSFLTPPAGEPLDPKTMLDISHETLIRQWKTLAGWVQAEAESATMYRRLLQDARLNRVGEVALWRPPGLHLALKWKEDQRPTAAWAARYSEGDGGGFALVTEFLEASRGAWQQEARARAEQEKRERERELQDAQRALRDSERERELARQTADAEKAKLDAARQRIRLYRYSAMFAVLALLSAGSYMVSRARTLEAREREKQATALSVGVQNALKRARDSIAEFQEKTAVLTAGLEYPPQGTDQDTASAGQGDSTSLDYAPWLTKRWRPGSTVRVAFLDGSPDLQAKVGRSLRQWVENTSLKLVFVEGTDGEIRISFAQPGSWSLLGTDALGVPRGEPTMNLGFLRSSSSDQEIAATTLHEFGHALGLVHEHQSPNAEIPWDRPAVYRFYAKPPYNWPREQVDNAFFRKYSGPYRPFDPLSVMLFPLPKELTGGRLETRQNTRLSAGDRALAQCLYPPDGGSATSTGCLVSTNQRR